MENKYYTPKIEELHVGMYCEWLQDPANEIYIPVELTANMLSLTLNTTGWNFERLNVPGSISYRVKYLDREDIESLGWVHTGRSIDDWFKWEERVRLESGHYISFKMHYGYHDQKLTINGDDGGGESCFFEGYVKNKSELKK